MANKFLIIQTAFTGDVVLATALIETLRSAFPDAQIDFLLRKGNEGLLQGHPFITNLLTWDKKTGKNRNLIRLAMQVRREGYTHIINPHRFGSSGFITFMSGAGYKAGFTKNPFAFCYNKKVAHILSKPYTDHPVHEVDRNHLLIADITGGEASGPKLYPSDADRAAVAPNAGKPYICVAPASVWFTKQFPADRWAAMLNELPRQYRVYIIGAPTDGGLGDTIVSGTTHPDVVNLCGKLNFLQSAALMQGAVMNYTNDSAPLHFASAMHAPVTAVFCSTVPAFGFGPLGDNGTIVEIQKGLACRPCGLHGHKECPQGHFRCAKEIMNEQLLWWTSRTT